MKLLLAIYKELCDDPFPLMIFVPAALLVAVFVGSFVGENVFRQYLDYEVEMRKLDMEQQKLDATLKPEKG